MNLPLVLAALTLVVMLAIAALCLPVHEEGDDL